MTLTPTQWLAIATALAAFCVVATRYFDRRMFDREIGRVERAFDKGLENLSRRISAAEQKADHLRNIVQTVDECKTFQQRIIDIARSGK